MTLEEAKTALTGCIVAAVPLTYDKVESTISDILDAVVREASRTAVLFLLQSMSNGLHNAAQVVRDAGPEASLGVE
jgi:hypothetical protein